MLQCEQESINLTAILRFRLHDPGSPPSGTFNHVWIAKIDLSSSKGGITLIAVDDHGAEVDSVAV